MQHGSFQKFGWLLGFVALAAVAGGCKKHVASTAPSAPPAAAPAQPTVTLDASPTSVNPGQAVTLSWTSTNSTDLEIDPGVGKVYPRDLAR